MMDIIDVIDGEDLGVFDTAVGKAGNVLSVQIGDLEYSSDFGVDLRYFLESQLEFQNESFKAYCVQRLAEHQVNVSQVIETIETLFTQYTYSVGDIRQPSGGLIL